ncbi:MAG TPA: protein translocase subunit SecF [Bryobacteraceae bacterium]|nr:protein translocase subunit SecF [Bryobacteraceae bacterium]
MELFRNTNFDFIRRKWWFILPSLLLTLAGLASLYVKGGPRYSIDFRGGALADVRWEGAPPVEQIRAAVSARLEGVSVVVAHDLTGSTETLVAMQIPANGDLTVLRQTVDEALSTVHTKYSIRSFEVIGPQIGSDLRQQAFIATAGASAGMLLYLGWRFRLVYGVAAVVAMLHDAIITIGMFSLLDQEISLTVVAALLTLIGYSMNDTIVVFDRIRENRRSAGNEPLAVTINRSVNQTLSRTVLTSGLTLLTAVSLLVFGGAVLRGFSLALVIGIIAGTFSSIFIASPLLLVGESWFGGRSTVRVATPEGVSR